MRKRHCLYARQDALFELTDAVLCADGPVKTLVELSLAVEHRRGAMDSGYDVAYLSHALADLPLVLVGRLRSDRVILRDAGPARSGPKGGRPRKHGGVLSFARPDSWHEPEVTTVTDTTRYGKAEAIAWDRMHPRLTHPHPRPRPCRRFATTGSTSNSPSPPRIPGSSRTNDHPRHPGCRLPTSAPNLTTCWVSGTSGLSSPSSLC